LALRVATSNVFQILYELMNLDIGLARFTFDHFKYVDARIELRPLTRPIISYFLFPDDSTPPRRPWAN